MEIWLRGLVFSELFRAKILFSMRGDELRFAVIAFLLFSTKVQVLMTGLAAKHRTPLLLLLVKSEFVMVGFVFRQWTASTASWILQ